MDLAALILTGISTWTVDPVAASLDGPPPSSVDSSPGLTLNAIELQQILGPSAASSQPENISFLIFR